MAMAADQRLRISATSAFISSSSIPIDQWPRCLELRGRELTHYSSFPFHVTGTRARAAAGSRSFIHETPKP